jgi:hypothetical protein
MIPSQGGGFVVLYLLRPPVDDWSNYRLMHTWPTGLDLSKERNGDEHQGSAQAERTVQGGR